MLESGCVSLKNEVLQCSFSISALQIKHLSRKNYTYWLLPLRLPNCNMFHIFLKGEHHDENVVDVVLGGVSYWAIGYGLSYGSDTVSVYTVWTFRENCFLGDKYVLWLGILVCGWFWSDDWPHIHYVLLSGPLLTSIPFYGSEIYYLRSIHSWVVKTSF